MALLFFFHIQKRRK